MHLRCAYKMTPNHDGIEDGTYAYIVRTLKVLIESVFGPSDQKATIERCVMAGSTMADGESSSLQILLGAISQTER